MCIRDRAKTTGAKVGVVKVRLYRPFCAQALIDAIPDTVKKITVPVSYTHLIMCVPAHDDRDFEFAKKFNIPIIQVISKDGKEIENMTEAYTCLLYTTRCV